MKNTLENETTFEMKDLKKLLKKGFPWFLKLGGVFCFCYLFFDSIAIGLGWILLSWLLKTVIDGWITASSKKRKEDLEVLYERLNNAAEKRTRVAVRELKGTLKAYIEEQENQLPTK